MKNLNDILITAQQKGIYNGEIKLIIVRGLIERAEYQVRDWVEDIKTMDGIERPKSG